MINCIVIEDEPLAQNGLLNLIRSYPKLQLLSVCDDISDFMQYQKENPEKDIELLFLDIELPGMNGINFIRHSRPAFPVILTTAYHEFAIEGFELNVLDYLLKPISKARFSLAVAKVESYLDSIKSITTAEPDFIFVKSEKVLEKILLNEIIIVEAMRNYVIYHCEHRKLVSYMTLKNVENTLPPNQFIKVQKSFIVNKNKVRKIEKGSVFIHDKTITINRPDRNIIIQKLTSL